MILSLIMERRVLWRKNFGLLKIFVVVVVVHVCVVISVFYSDQYVLNIKVKWKLSYSNWGKSFLLKSIHHITRYSIILSHFASQKNGPLERITRFFFIRQIFIFIKKKPLGNLRYGKEYSWRELLGSRNRILREIVINYIQG